MKFWDWEFQDLDREEQLFKNRRKIPKDLPLGNERPKDDDYETYAATTNKVSGLQDYF